MEAFDIFDVCEELRVDAKIITTRWENVPRGDKWRCRFAAREFRHDDLDVEGLYTSSSTASTGRLGGHACGPASLFDLVPRCRERVLPEVACGESLVEAEEGALREKEGCEESSMSSS